MLPKIEAALLARANGDFVESYTIDGRSISTMGILELEQLRDRYARMVTAETGGAGGQIVLGRLRPA